MCARSPSAWWRRPRRPVSGRSAPKGHATASGYWSTCTTSWCTSCCRGYASSTGSRACGTAVRPSPWSPRRRCHAGPRGGVRRARRVPCACAGRRGALAASRTEIEPGPRPAGAPVQPAIALEGRRLLAALQPGEHVVALDERGRELSTRELATWLSSRVREGQDVAFLIGGPDGLASEVRAHSHFTLSLSRLTLPHALVRVLLSEQLYRAHCILTHHPYHRD